MRTWIQRLASGLPDRTLLMVAGPLFLSAVGILVMGYRLGRIERIREETGVSVGRLRGHLDRVQGDVEWATRERVEDRYVQLKTHLLEGVDGARDWVARTERVAGAQGFRLVFRWADAESLPGSMERAERVRVFMELSPDSHSDSGPGTTMRLVQFLRDLEAGQPPMEWLRLTASGSRAGLLRASIEARLWIHLP